MKPRIFQATWEQVWNRQKTITNRPIRAYDTLYHRKDAGKRISVKGFGSLETVEAGYIPYRVVNTDPRLKHKPLSERRIEWEVGSTFLMKPERPGPEIVRAEARRPARTQAGGTAGTGQRQPGAGESGQGSVPVAGLDSKRVCAGRQHEPRF